MIRKFVERMLTNTSPVREADVHTVADAVRGGAPLLDVREIFEFNSGHVADAVSVPMHLVPIRLDELARDVTKDQTIYVICRSGNRSWQVCHFLTQHGFDAVNVAGGMVSWQSAGLPVAVEGSDGQRGAL